MKRLDCYTRLRLFGVRGILVSVSFLNGLQHNADYVLHILGASNLKILGFICPLGKDDSKTRIRSDDIMENIIEPIAEELGYKVQRADRMNGSNIMTDIISMLKESDIVIADLTEFNPNVFYELGLRQALKGKCINIVCDDWLTELENSGRDIPFDITYYRAHRYKYGNFRNSNDFRKFIKNRIKNLEKQLYDPCFNLTSEDVMTLYGTTVVTDFRKGSKNHYELARELFAEPCKSIFLMQRSSSLVLNAEQGWGAEAIFVDSIKKAMNDCEMFYHIISLEGIEAHFNRTNSVFPNFKNFADNLIDCNGIAAMKVPEHPNAKFFLKKLQKDNKNTLFKLDRQARVLITETYSGKTNAIIVQNLGPDQTSFQITGPKANEYLKECIEFYNSCEYVHWNEINTLYKKYQTIENKRRQ